ncbi:unnamed protein product [Peniophora sp. CBMAI 1063]|nr:unnamed protein product [Peniophora sp. CBMAI 1063]
MRVFRGQEMDSENWDYEMEKRRPLSMVGRVVDSGRKDEEGQRIFQCAAHSLSSCRECFNWKKLMRAQVKPAKNDHGKVSDRDQLSGLLAAMGAPVAGDTKLDESGLEHKLRLALNYAQNMAKFLNRMPINPVELAKWKDVQRRPVFDAVRRSNMAEVLKVAEARRTTGNASSAFPLYANAFMDLRQTIMSLAKNFDTNHPVALLQDENQRAAISMRMLDVYMLDNTTPLIALIYEPANAQEQMVGSKTMQFMQTQVMPLGNENCAQIRCTLEEQALLRRLLYLNSTKLSPAYETTLAADQRAFKRSFILPIGPLDEAQIGKLTSNTGCAVCGASQTKACSACHCERYCGPACQKAHWKEHKATCHSLQGGTWTDFAFVSSPDMNSDKVVDSLLNLYAPSSEQHDAHLQRLNGLQPRPDVHGDRTFLLKVQYVQTDHNGDPPNPPQYVVHDRERSLEGYLRSKGRDSPWTTLVKQIPPMAVGEKIYRWARRTGDWELNICLDREPQGVETLSW